MEGSEWFVRYRETTDKRIATLEAKLLESQGQVGELTALVARLEATMRDFDDTLQQERGRRIEAHEEAQQKPRSWSLFSFVCCVTPEPVKRFDFPRFFLK